MVYLLPILLAVAAGPAWASPAEEPKPKEDIAYLDSTRNALGSGVNGIANRLDAFFATERADDEFGRTRIRIQPIYFMRDRAPGDYTTRYRINLRLPHLEEKFKWDYYRDMGKTEEQLAKEKVTRKEVREAEKRSEVKTGWLFNADAGVSLAVPPRIITRARLRKNFEQEIWIHRFVEQLIYITDERGLTNELGLSNDYRLDDTKLFRFVNNARWRIHQKQFATFHGPSVLHQYTDRDAFSYSFFMTNLLIHGTYFTNSYTFSVDWRRNVHKDWIFLDVIPGIDFPKQWSFRRTPFLTLQLEILFGG